MKNYSIMALDTAHLEEICRDIKEQFETGVCTLPLMVFKLVPEGNPAIDKASLECGKFDLFRDKLEAEGVPCGILAQCTIGHGYPLNQMFGFQQVIGFKDGAPYTIACPYDEGFREYIRGQFRTMAQHRPKEIMVDDDLRLMRRYGVGCACPLHMAAFNRKAGTNLTREELWGHIQSNTPLGKKYTDIFVETQKEAVVGAAQAMRDGIDSVDPTIPGSFCSAGEAAEFGAELGQVLAGKGNPVVVRLNNSNYHADGARKFSNSMFLAAQAIAVMDGRVDVILAETDTCPQNRYSTSAQQLHSHFTGSILEGAGGAKHWITRLAYYEPNSGKAYRKILSKNAGFYEALSKLVPELTWQGCRLPVSKVPEYGFQKQDIWTVENDAWSLQFLERMGLPMYYSANPGGAVFLDGYGDWRFTDAQILEFFKGPVFLASDTAKRLNDRGFRAYTGVDVAPWTGAHPSTEILSTGGGMQVQKNVMALTPICPEVQADSTVYHLHNGKELQPLFPGVTVYKNPAGGTTVVFSGTPKCWYHYTEGFSFLNESRKAQVARLLKDCGQLPVYYPGDAEVYFRTALTASGERFCGFFNIGLDPIEEITLVTEAPVTKVEKLNEKGERVPCRFDYADGLLTVYELSYTLNPVILFLQ